MAMRKFLALVGIAASITLSSVSPGQAQQAGSIVNVAVIGEPASLDPGISATDLVGMISQHVFETLFTFDSKWNVTPLLAEAMPNISADGTVYKIALRQGIKFHNGREMTAEDVVASLKRWM